MLGGYQEEKGLKWMAELECQKYKAMLKHVSFIFFGGGRLSGKKGVSGVEWFSGVEGRRGVGVKRDGLKV